MLTSITYRNKIVAFALKLCLSLTALVVFIVLFEISMIRDYLDKLGLIYYVLPDEKRGRGEIYFMDITEKYYFIK